MKLPPKQRRFVSEYLKDQNGRQAAIRAGYSRKTANEQASQLLAKLNIRAEIDTALGRIQMKAEVTQERILKALLIVAELDPRKVFNADGTMKAMHEMPDEAALAIASIESDDAAGELRKVKFADKIRALELLGRHLKMFVDRTEVTDGSGAPVIIQMVSANSDEAKDRKSPDDKGL